MWCIGVSVDSLSAADALSVGYANDQPVPEAFQCPNEFIPERWTTRPELVIDSRAYAPFSVGEYLFS